MILDLRTGLHVEVVIPIRVPTPRLEERAGVKAACPAEKQESRRAAA